MATFGTIDNIRQKINDISNMRGISNNTKKFLKACCGITEYDPKTLKSCLGFTQKSIDSMYVLVGIITLGIKNRTSINVKETMRSAKPTLSKFFNLVYSGNGKNILLFLNSSGGRWFHELFTAVAGGEELYTKLCKNVSSIKLYSRGSRKKADESLYKLENLISAVWPGLRILEREDYLESNAKDQREMDDESEILQALYRLTIDGKKIRRDLIRALNLRVYHSFTGGLPGLVESNYSDYSIFYNPAGIGTATVPPNTTTTFRIIVTKHKRVEKLNCETIAECIHSILKKFGGDRIYNESKKRFRGEYTNVEALSSELQNVVQSLRRLNIADDKINNLNIKRFENPQDADNAGFKMLELVDSKGNNKDETVWVPKDNNNKMSFAIVIPNGAPFSADLIALRIADRIMGADQGTPSSTHVRKRALSTSSIDKAQTKVGNAVRRRANSLFSRFSSGSMGGGVTDELNSAREGAGKNAETRSRSSSVVGRLRSASLKDLAGNVTRRLSRSSKKKKSDSVSFNEYTNEQNQNKEIWINDIFRQAIKKVNIQPGQINNKINITVLNNKPSNGLIIDGDHLKFTRSGTGSGGELTIGVWVDYEKKDDLQVDELSGGLSEAINKQLKETSEQSVFVTNSITSVERFFKQLGLKDIYRSKIKLDMALSDADPSLGGYQRIGDTDVLFRESNDGKLHFAVIQQLKKNFNPRGIAAEIIEYLKGKFPNEEIMVSVAKPVFNETDNSPPKASVNDDEFVKTAPIVQIPKGLQYTFVASDVNDEAKKKYIGEIVDKLNEDNNLKARLFEKFGKGLRIEIDALDRENSTGRLLQEDPSYYKIYLMSKTTKNNITTINLGIWTPPMKLSTHDKYIRLRQAIQNHYHEW